MPPTGTPGLHAPTDLTIPPAAAPADARLNWLLGATSEGQAWLQAQKPATVWDQVRVALGGTNASEQLAGLSNLVYNKTKRSVREIVASLSSFRHEGEFKPRWDSTLYGRAQELTKLDADWYRRLGVVRTIRAGVQYAVGFGTGYFYQTWDNDLLGPGDGDIKLQALAPDAVTFVQMPEDHDLQKCYAVIVRETLPINLARAKYADLDGGRFAAALQPDSGNPNLIQKGLNKVQQFVAPVLRLAGLNRQQATSSFPTVDVFHAYIDDRSVNDSGFPVDMGREGTNWAYAVPSLGDPVPTGQVNPQTRQPFTRPAEPADCRLYPRRRLCVYARTGLGYDGASPWWHGRVPVARLRLMDWAWEALGGSTPAEILPIEQGVVALMRMMEDSWAARLDPPVLYDRDKVSDSFMDAFNPRRAGARAGADINMGKVLEYPVPPDQYNVPQGVPQFITEQEARMDYLSGATDIVAIAKAKQVPGADALEKLMEMAGPIVQDMIRALEAPLTELGQQRLAMYLQFYTGPRVITVVGPDGKKSTEQFVPALITPPAAEGESPAQHAARRRRQLLDYAYEVTESGINEIHRMTTKLFYVQLLKSGFPIDWWTCAEVFQIPSFGPVPQGTNNVLERWTAQKRIEVELMGYAAQLAAAQGLAGTGGAPPGAGAGPPGASQDRPTGQSGPGRPSANTAAPRIESKDGGARSTVATSE